MLSAIIFLPLVTAIVILTMAEEKLVSIRRLAEIAAFLSFVGTLFLAYTFDPSAKEMQFVNSFHWVSALHINFKVGVDGISLWLLVLTAFLGILAIRFADPNQKNFRNFIALTLMLEAGTLGVFVALDTILFYVFWELMLIPTYFLIGLWGEGERVYATTKFVIYTLVGSLLMLVGIVWITVIHFQATGHLSFDLVTLLHTEMPKSEQLYMFIFFFLAFAIKVPIFPFHSWLPHTYKSCPISTLILLTGAMSKTGAYGLIRFCVPLFPEAMADWALWIGTMAAGGIVYGAWIAVAQKDIKSIVAYSSISHLGFIALGIFAFNGKGVEGSVLQMVNHGIIASALFIIVGIVEQRTGTRDLNKLSGLKKSMPVLYGIFMLIMLAALGLPGLNGFVGEFLILIGVWTSTILDQLSVVYVVLAGLAIVFASIYMLFMFQGTMQEKPTDVSENVKDLNSNEVGLLIPACVLVVVIGLYPKPLIDLVSPSADHVLTVKKTVKLFSAGSDHGGH